MIPISQDEKIVYEDKTSGVRYFIRPKTGNNEIEYINIAKKYKKGISQKEEWEIMGDEEEFDSDEEFDDEFEDDDDDDDDDFMPA